MYHNDDKVWIECSAKEDVGFLAWDYVKSVSRGTIKGVLAGEKDPPVPESPSVYAIEFTAPFSGGIDCNGLCLPRQGQWISAKHLSLDFEASCDANTIPNMFG